MVVVVVLAWWATCSQLIIADGGFDLTVTVSSKSGPLRSVRCTAAGDRATAEFYVRHPGGFDTSGPGAEADPYDGRPLTIHVPISVRYSAVGLVVARSQFRGLAVVGMTADGQRVAVTADIPDSRVARDVTVILP